MPSLVSAGETIASHERQVFAGGKGLNQSLAAARAGARVHHYGAVGEDGEILMQALLAQGVDTGGVLQLAGPSGHAVIQVDSAGQNAIVISGGSNRQLSRDLFAKALAELNPGDWVLLQNEINDVDVVIHMAAEQGAQVAFNVAPPDARIHSYPIDLLALLIVNEPEAQALASVADTASAFRTLIQRFPHTHLVLTRGKEGLWVYDAQAQSCMQMSAFKVQPVDETAAGDAFVGYLLAGLVAGKTLSDTLIRASAAGALAVTTQGAAPSIPSSSAVDTLLATQTAPSFAAMG